jgi:hypothetical protein
VEVTAAASAPVEVPAAAMAAALVINEKNR